MPELKLSDGCVKLFFNSKGRDHSNLTDKQRAFIEYVESENVTDELTTKIDIKVKEVRENKKWRREYMKALLHDQDIRDEAEAALTEKYESILVQKDEEYNLMLAGKDAEYESMLAGKDAEIASLKAQLEQLMNK